MPSLRSLSHTGPNANLFPSFEDGMLVHDPLTSELPPREPPSLRGLSWWFALVTAYCLMGGLLAILASGFVGPHLLVGGILHVALGLAAAYAAAGISSCWRGSWIVGCCVMVTRLGVTVHAAVHSSGTESFLFILVAVLFGLVTQIHCSETIRRWCGRKAHDQQSSVRVHRNS